MIGGLGFFVTLWLGGFWQGWQWNNPSIPFIDTVVALKPVWLVRFFSGTSDFPAGSCRSPTTSWRPSSAREADEALRPALRRRRC